MSSGSVLRTEFSASTGGYTTAGILDEGDSIGGNPHHSWRQVVSTDRLNQHFGRGRLLDTKVTKRNGFGAFGGRVVEIELRFERGTVATSGTTVRRVLGLKSDWFNIH